MINNWIIFKTVFVLLMVSILPIDGKGQNSALLPELLKSYPVANSELIESRLNGFVSSLQIKKSKQSEVDFLKLIFRESHRRFFKNYKPYTQFAEIFETGNYDCLSATSFLSLVLDEFHFDYKIIETNYHIFISVETKKGTVLLESTDRFSGVVANPKEINERISRYRANDLISQSEKGKIYYHYNLNLYQIVEPNQLPGLLYFNQAVIAFNKKYFFECAEKLKKASRIYESPRTAELAMLLVKSVVDSDLSEEEKMDLIKPFSRFISMSSVIASR